MSDTQKTVELTNGRIAELLIIHNRWPNLRYDDAVKLLTDTWEEAQAAAAQPMARAYYRRHNPLATPTNRPYRWRKEDEGMKPTKDDLITALSVMKTVMQKAQLVSEPCDTMIKQIKEWEVYDDNDLQRAFLLGALTSNPSVDNLIEMDLPKRYKIVKQFIDSLYPIPQKPI